MGASVVEQTKLWGGRFSTGPSKELAELSRAPASYFRLFPEDIAGSRAHARELLRAGVLDEAEFAATRATLDAIEADVASGRETPVDGDEDVHTFLERLLIDRLGPLGGKLRAGRSRNDQTANNTRLYLRKMARRLALGLLDVQEALLEQATRHVGTVIPGFTHLQPAQPVSLGHHLMAHAQSLGRDIDRLCDWDRRFDRSPLGAAALAGSAIARRPDLSARDLGYSGACENSIDAVASRDHVAEYLFIAAMAGVDLSRLAEEICIWSSKPFSWVRLDDGYSTGSSIMPQKKNPDIAELTRGMSGTLVGNVTGCLVMMKGMPLAYNRDLAEDKRLMFETNDILELVLPAFAGMVRTMAFDVERLRAQAPQGFTLATEIADWLVGQNIPFAEAHEITGAVVRHCERKGIDLAGLEPADLAAVDGRLKPELLQALTLERALSVRDGHGATAPARVREQIERFRAVMARQRAWGEAPALRTEEPA